MGGVPITPITMPSPMIAKEPVSTVPVGSVPLPTAQSKTDPRLTAVGQQFPRLTPYLSQVQVQSGKKSSPRDDRGLEFYPPWESKNPNPGKITLELFDSLKGDQLTTALGGDLLHYLGGVDPRTNKPIDAEYQKLKTEVMNSRTSHQDTIDRRIYEDEKRTGGETRSYEDWLQQSRIDAYIRGYVTPELGGRYPDEWRKNGWYDDPRMKKAVEKIKTYVTTAQEAK
jgi:hypothetical protein